MYDDFDHDFKLLAQFLQKLLLEKKSESSLSFIITLVQAVS